MAGAVETEAMEDDISKCNAALDTPIVLPPPIELESVHDVTIDKIASKLLKDNFILTALELHAELLESGRELPRLRDYFSNPGNFEKHSHSAFDASPVLPRTSSVQTFDSLDFARYSDDGEKQLDERVAVLEFELRKARETIKNLRANLTVVTESDPNTPDNGSEHTAEDPLRPHERRAVNFLLNEYLLKHDYKLTSITFSDENEVQDFEDWDDVGLNIPKPPDLVQLYRSYNKHSRLWCDVADRQVQTEWESDLIKLEELESTVQNLLIEKSALEAHIDLITAELDKEREEKLVLAEELDKVLFTCSAQAQLAFKPELPLAEGADMLSDAVEPCMPASPTTQRGQRPEEKGDSVLVEGPCTAAQPSLKEADQGHLDAQGTEPLEDAPSPQGELGALKSQRRLLPAFLEALLGMCRPHREPSDMRLAKDVTRVASSGEEVVLMLARCLPHIVPNVLLAKREELVPLLLATINLHPDAAERDALLNLLFNLTKRPDDAQRRVILTGLLSVAKCLGHERVEAELLPQCWEQINHKYLERRLLVAESCGYLAPQVASEIRSSLLLSMLQQMLKEEKEDAVRESATRSLAVLLAYVDDQDKFSQAVDLALLVVTDARVNMADLAQTVLLPSVAAWALEIGRLEDTLLATLMKLLDDHTKALALRSADGSSALSQSEELRSVHLIKALRALLPFLFVRVLETGPYMARLNLTDGGASNVILENSRLLPPQNALLDPLKISSYSVNMRAIIEAFDEHIGQEWYKTWPAYDWLLSKFLPFLTGIAASMEPSSRTTVHALSELLFNFCRVFGHTFTKCKVKPAFSALVPLSEVFSQDVKNTLTSAVGPVYASGILAAFSSDADRKELVAFLRNLLFVVSLSELPLSSMESVILELSTDKSHHEVLLSVLWEGVVHNTALVRSNAGRLFELLVGTVADSLLRSRVTPALVTLASDPDISVRIGTVRPFGTILATCTQKDLLDKAFMQLQTFLEDPQHRDDHAMQAEFIRMFASLGPNTEPRFRDEFILPHLAILAMRNNQNSNESSRMKITELLLEAYSALSCTYIPEHAISDAFLPGLRCLLEDVRQVAPCHEPAVTAMIGDFEAKLDCSRERTPSLSSPMASMEEMKRKMTKIFAVPPANARSNLPNIFQLRKK